MCPMSLVTQVICSYDCSHTDCYQWQEEIEKHTKPGRFSILLYYGSDRVKDPSILSLYDIVITTFGTLTAESSKQGEKV